MNNCKNCRFYKEIGEIGKGIDNQVKRICTIGNRTNGNISNCPDFQSKY
jgi:hypothetical protein